MKIRRIAKIAVAVSVILTALTSTAFCQMQGGPGMSQGRGPVMGEVSAIDSQSLTVTTRTGEGKQVAISARTSFVKEVVSDKSALSQGTSIFVMGQSTDQNSINPKVIVIIDKSENLPRPGVQDGAAQGGQSQMMSGPVIGTITSADPLTIQKSSGETAILQMTSETKILREVSINAADVVKGMRVRVIAPPTPEGGLSEARKVMVLSEMGPPR